MQNITLWDKLIRLSDLSVGDVDTPIKQQIFYIEKKGYIYIDQYEANSSYSIKDHYDIHILKLDEDRGELLEIFSRLEFLTNTIIKVYLFDLENHYDFDEILDYVSLSNRIKLLTKFGLIEKKMQGKISNLIGIRNKYAHVWKIEKQDIKDKNKTKDDLIEIFDHLISVYQKQLKAHGFEQWIDECLLYYDQGKKILYIDEDEET